jgi:hypothetical protein
MKFVRHTLTVALLAALSSWSCGGKTPTEANKPAASSPVAAAPNTGSGDEVSSSAVFSAMRWRFSDKCADSKAIQARLYDRAAINGLVFPTNGGTFKTLPGKATEKVIQCRTGHRICPGVTTAPQTSMFWGVGIDGNKKCVGCCRLCAPKTILVEVSCPAKKPAVYISKSLGAVEFGADEASAASDDEDYGDDGLTFSDEDAVASN